MYNYKKQVEDYIFVFPSDSDMQDYLPDTRSYNLFLHLRREGSSFEHAYNEAHRDHEVRNVVTTRISTTDPDRPDPLQQRIQALTTDALQLIWNNWTPEISSAALAAQWYDQAAGISLLEYYMALDWELSWRRLHGR